MITIELRREKDDVWTNFRLY